MGEAADVRSLTVGEEVDRLDRFLADRLGLDVRFEQDPDGRFRAIVDGFEAASAAAEAAARPPSVTTGERP